MKSITKKFIGFALSLMLVLVSVCQVSYAAKKTPYQDTSYKPRTVLKSEFIQRNSNIGWHPAFNRYNKVDGYYFSTKNKQKFDVSLSVAKGPVSVSVNKAANSSNGTIVKANGSKWSRPRVYGDIIRDTVKIKCYERNKKTVVGEYIKYEYRVVNTYIKPIYK